jgi:hypothetical protein
MNITGTLPVQPEFEAKLEGQSQSFTHQSVSHDINTRVQAQIWLQEKDRQFI